MKEPPWRTNVAVCLCVCSALLAAATCLLSRRDTFDTIQSVAIVWFFTGLWLTGSWNNSDSFHQKAFEVSLPKKRKTMAPIPKIMLAGAVLLSALGLTLLLAQ